MKYVVTIADYTQKVTSEWRGDDDQTPPPAPDGFTNVEVPDGVSVTGHRYVDEAFEAPGPTRIISRGDFMDRFTPTTQMALEELAEAHTASGRLTRVFMRRLEAEEMVDLDAAALSGALAQLRAVLTAVGVPGWATAQDADASVAAILA